MALYFRRFYSAGKGKKTVEEIAHMISTRQVRNIVVMAGAGISTASGIPDFRYSCLLYVVLYSLDSKPLPKVSQEKK